MGRKTSAFCNRCGDNNFATQKYTRDNKQYFSRYCKSCARNNSYKQTREKLTGFTPEEYEQKLIEQNYTCAICGTHQSELKRALAADHNHITNQKRGLLCTRCNMLLGYAKDDPSILSRATVYLLEYE